MKRVGLLVAVVLLALPAAARATVHTGHIVFKEPQNPPSIGEPGLPADQRTEDIREVLVRYDASAGSLTVEAEAYDPAYWGERLRFVGPLGFGQTVSEDFSIGPKCGESSPPLSGSIIAYPKPTNETPEQELENSGDSMDVTGGVAGEASLGGYEGRLD